MANRRLYNERAFLVKKVDDFRGNGEEVWHVVGSFTDGSIVSKEPQREYRIRVKPDPRWKNAHRLVFHADKVYECESIGYHSRRHIYGSGKWYLSPVLGGEFAFDDFDVTMKAAVVCSST